MNTMDSGRWSVEQIEASDTNLSDQLESEECVKWRARRKASKQADSGVVLRGFVMLGGVCGRCDSVVVG